MYGGRKLKDGSGEIVSCGESRYGNEPVLMDVLHTSPWIL
jgi:hypothetical protein